MLNRFENVTSLRGGLRGSNSAALTARLVWLAVWLSVESSGDGKKESSPALLAIRWEKMFNNSVKCFLHSKQQEITLLFISYFYHLRCYYYNFYIFLKSQPSQLPNRLAGEELLEDIQQNRNQITTWCDVNRDVLVEAGFYLCCNGIIVNQWGVRAVEEAGHHANDVNYYQ